MNGKGAKSPSTTKPVQEFAASHLRSAMEKTASHRNVNSGLGLDTKIAVGILGSYEAYFKSPGAKLSAIKKGLESQAITDLMTITGATQTDVAHILDLTEPTLRKYIKAGKGLNTGLSEHILQLFELFDKGMDTFGSLEEFKNWLPQHNIGINAKPIELLDTMTGIHIVMNELLRIDYGVLA